MISCGQQVKPRQVKHIYPLPKRTYWDVWLKDFFIIDNTIGNNMVMYSAQGALFW